jgi:hypothetical protein
MDPYRRDLGRFQQRLKRGRAAEESFESSSTRYLKIVASITLPGLVGGCVTVGPYADRVPKGVPYSVPNPSFTVQGDQEVETGADGLPIMIWVIDKDTNQLKQVPKLKIKGFKTFSNDSSLPNSEHFDAPDKIQVMTEEITPYGRMVVPEIAQGPEQQLKVHHMNCHDQWVDTPVVLDPNKPGILVYSHSKEGRQINETALYNRGKIAQTPEEIALAKEEIGKLQKVRIITIKESGGQGAVIIGKSSYDYWLSALSIVASMTGQVVGAFVGAEFLKPSQVNVKSTNNNTNANANINTAEAEAAAEQQQEQEQQAAAAAKAKAAAAAKAARAAQAARGGTSRGHTYNSKVPGLN